MVELLVVVFVIGVLMLIALPAFFGARDRAAARAAQADIRTGFAAAMTYYSEAGDFTGYDLVEAERAEPALEWVTGAVPAGRQIEVHVALGDELLLIAVSRTGTYYCLAQTSSSPLTSTGSADDYFDVDTVGECTTGW